MTTTDTTGPLAGRIRITDDQFTTALDQAVTVRGADWTYPDAWRTANGTCRYLTSDGSGPGCLMGAALLNLGIPLSTLAEFEGLGIGAALEQLFTGFTNVVLHAAIEAQTAQDGDSVEGAPGKPWGECARIYHHAIHAVRAEQDGQS